MREPQSHPVLWRAWSSGVHQIVSIAIPHNDRISVFYRQRRKSHSHAITESRYIATYIAWILARCRRTSLLYYFWIRDLHHLTPPTSSSTSPQSTADPFADPRTLFTSDRRVFLPSRHLHLPAYHCVSPISLILPPLINPARIGYHFSSTFSFKESIIAC